MIQHPNKKLQVAEIVLTAWTVLTAFKDDQHSRVQIRVLPFHPFSAFAPRAHFFLDVEFHMSSAGILVDGSTN